MHKARAMLDALMGPGRNEVKKESKEDFKDRAVCKGYLVGFCPLDKSILGGKRSLEVCQRIHSDLLKAKFESHPDREALTRDYEVSSLKDLEYCIFERDGHAASERQRIREDVRRKKPPLPAEVNSRIAQLKREANSLIQQADAMDDDRLREKEENKKKAAELKQEAEEVLTKETKKAIEALPPEELCEVCATAYTGSEEYETHLQYRVHKAYQQVRDRIKELKARRDEWEKEAAAKKEEERKKKRKEEWDKAQQQEKEENGKKEKDGKDRSRSRSRSRSRDRDKLARGPKRATDGGLLQARRDERKDRRDQRNGRGDERKDRGDERKERGEERKDRGRSRGGRRERKSPSRSKRKRSRSRSGGGGGGGGGRPRSRRRSR